MGLAVYNSIILDIRFPPCCYKKLLSPAVVPYQDPNAIVGIANLGLEDLMEAMPVSSLYTWLQMCKLESAVDKCDYFSESSCGSGRFPSCFSPLFQSES